MFTSVHGPSWPNHNFAQSATSCGTSSNVMYNDCGGDTVRVMSELRSMHAEGGNPNHGIDGSTGQITDMAELGIFEAFAVKSQTIKTAIESAIMLLRIDDICSGSKPKNSAYGNALDSGQLDDM